jgi:hypothetical protein
MDWSAIMNNAIGSAMGCVLFAVLCWGSSWLKQSCQRIHRRWKRWRKKRRKKRRRR